LPGDEFTVEDHVVPGEHAGQPGQLYPTPGDARTNSPALANRQSSKPPPP
jgi:hypothetical protein